MFKSFFPSPRWFFLSALAWTSLAVAGWFLIGDSVAGALGIVIDPEAAPVIGLGHFATPDFQWFYLYVVSCFALFAVAWMLFAPHRWQWWSIVGSALILFSTYFSVQVSVALNNWRRPFFDLVQKGLGGEGFDSGELFAQLLIFAQIALIWMVVYVLTRFFVSHYVFRWRTAMNNYYTSRWSEVRHIEGASQRVQEDTMRFAGITEGLGVAFIDAIMTLFAFLPILLSLSEYVTELPIVGEIPAPLLTAAIVWAVFGTGLLALVGIKLPGLEFKNQRVEAAFRKELVYGEDSAARAQPMQLAELFDNVRRNYFRLYMHYMYFNIARGLYLQSDSIFYIILLIPTIAAGKITLGIYQQIASAFNQVSNSFQFLVNSWSTIVELLSVYKRLASFEAAFEGRDLVHHDRHVED